MSNADELPRDIPPIYIVSGGAGALGKHVARIALSQFPDVDTEIVVIPQIRYVEELPEVVEQVAGRNGVIIHTMVDPVMRRALIRLADERRVPAIDTIGDHLSRLATLFGREPVGLPGLYQREHEVYLERIRAIEYTVEHDDGRNPHELDQAEIVLTGVSRVGKTPLSIYLSVLGWKVANVPLVPGVVEPPPELFQIDRRRVVGLTIDPNTLAQHRSWRQIAYGGAAGRAYTDLEKLYEETDAARRRDRRGGFTVVDVTNKPIEETADQVVARISRWFEHKVQR
mgnify:CR=1 FL=1